MDANFLFLGLLFLGQGVLIYFLVKKAAEFVDSSLDTMSKLAQIVSIHQKSRSAAEAVEQTLVLDSNLRALDRAELAMDAEKKPPAKRPTGFKDASGKIIKCAPDMMEKVMSKVPKDRLVYE